MGLAVDGSHLWSQQWGTAGREAGGGPVVVDDAGHAIVGGMFKDTVVLDGVFDGATCTSTGDWDIFLGKLEPRTGR